MKTIEEKAKAYDEALKAAIAAHKDEDRHLKATLERIFPELQESEDERIRKGLIKALSSIGKRNWGGIDVFESISWLEKQGEQKTVGITTSLINKMVNDYKNTDEYVEGDYKGKPINCMVRAYRQGINDALNLALKTERQGEQKPTSDTMYKVSASGSLIIVNDKPFDYEKATITQKDFAPEQETKFKVGDMVCKKKDNSFCATINSITDTVYLCDVFDSDGDYDDDYAFLISEQDEYELVAKKIEDEIEIPFGAKDSELQEATYYIPKGFHAEIEADKVVIKKGEKSAWSDEDEEMLQSCTGAIWAADSCLYEEKQEMEVWLKSLKDRIGG